MGEDPSETCNSSKWCVRKDYSVDYDHDIGGVEGVKRDKRFTKYHNRHSFRLMGDVEIVVQHSLDPVTLLEMPVRTLSSL